MSVRITVYADGLRVFTSSAPQRGLLKELVRLRSEDQFVFCLHEKFARNQILKAFFDSLGDFNNWQICTLKSSYKLSRLSFVMGRMMPELPENSDVYICSDIESISNRNAPVINFLPDLSVYDNVRHTSLSLVNTFIRRLSVRTMAKRSDKIITVSNFTASRFSHFFPTYSSKAEVLYNGIADAWFESNHNTRKPVSTAYWLWMGASFNSRKNLRRLLKAYKLLTETDGFSTLPDLLLIGLNTSSMERLKKLVRRNLLGGKIFLMPRVSQEEVISLLEDSCGLLLPSVYEGFGLPVIEAFSKGKPVLISNRASMPEVADGLAILCDPFDVGSIKDGLKKMYQLKEDEVVIQKRKSRASMFTYQKAAKEFSLIINRVTRNATDNA